MAVALAVFVAQAALAAGTPEQKCEAGKNDAAGRYAGCIGKALKSFIASDDAAKYADAISKCEAKLVASWSKLETAAANAATTCPSTGDGAAIGDFLDGCSQSVATALNGGTLGMDPVTCASYLSSCDGNLATCDGNLATCVADLATSGDDLATAASDLATCGGDLSTCVAATGKVLKTGQTTCYNDTGTLIPCTGTKRDGNLQKGVAFSYVDNGNGTITDQVTGLMWEKLSDDGSVHDRDNTYPGIAGAVAKAASVNAASFAGHSDWRVPNLRELQSLPDYSLANPCIRPVFNTGCVGGCTVLTCSCTRNFVYTSSTIYSQYSPANWKINFQDGDVYAGNSTDAYYVRLVRTAF